MSNFNDEFVPNGKPYSEQLQVYLDKKRHIKMFKFILAIYSITILVVGMTAGAIGSAIIIALFGGNCG